MNAVQIPAPSVSDSDKVVTALQMAALFGENGKEGEAVRWLKRAAESAGEEGDDARALALARTAAELTDRLERAPESGERASEPPVSASALHSAVGSAVGSPPQAAVEEALPIPLRRLAPPPPPSSRAPSSRAPSSRAPSSQAPSSQAPSSQAVSSRPPSSQAPTSRPPKPAPPRISTLPAPRVLRAVASSAKAKSSAQPRQTARVSVQPGSEPGSYVMRVLDDGETALPRDAVEGWIMLVDPRAVLPESSG